MTDKRHQAAKARDEWLDSEEGRRCAEILTLPVHNDHYLRNRIMLAFEAGWRAGEKHGGSE